MTQSARSERPFMTLREVWEFLNMSRSTFYRRQEGEPLLQPTHDFGPRSPRLERSRVLQYVEKCKRQGL